MTTRYRRSPFPWLAFTFTAGWLLWLTTARATAQETAASPRLDDGSRVLIPFDFESRFDDGRYGQIIGDLVWGKIKREGGFILPEAMQDVRDAAERRGFTPGPDTPLHQLARIVTDEEGAQIAIWGKVERVEGHDFDVYDLWIKVADFSGPTPRILFERQARTQTVSEIPHVHIQAALESLYGRSGIQVAPGVIDDSPDAPGTGPNLVQGDFEASSPSGPAGWEPLNRFTTVVPSPDGTGRVLRFSIPLDIAETSGVLYYSQEFPVDEGAVYEFRCRYRTNGPAPKVFIKAYDELTGTFTAKTKAAADAADASQKREVYRSQQNLKGQPGPEWHEQVETFTPRHSRYHPQTARIMLYGYLHAGVIDWDDISVRLVKPAPSAPARP